jgi:hypothetical protein
MESISSAGPYDARIKSQAKILICGSSSSGKTSLCYKILKHCDQLMTDPPKEIFYFYQMDQPMFKEMKSTLKIPIRFISGVPTAEMLEEIVQSPIKPNMCILDDFGQFLNKNIANLFQVGSHHGCVSLILLLQNLFGRNKYAREISLSSSHIFLIRNIRDATIAHFLGRQLMPGQAKEFEHIYRQATPLPYSYLCIDLTQECHEDLRYRSSIFPGEEMKCWVTKTREEELRNI